MEEPTQPKSSTTALDSRSAAALRELEARARAALAAQRDQMARLEAEIAAQMDALEQTLAAERAAEAADAREADKAREEAAKLRAELDDSRTAWQQQHAAEESKLAELRAELERSAAEQADKAKELAELGRQLNAAQTALEEQTAQWTAREEALKQREAAVEKELAALKTDQSSLETTQTGLKAERDELVEKLAKLEAKYQSAQDKWQTQLVDFQQKLHDAQTAGERDRSESGAAEAVWKTERSELIAAPTAAQQKLESSATEQTSAITERDELQQKFELALADVQRYRGRVAEMEQELASRPAAGASDSTELVALCAEREALAAQVEELQSQPKGAVDPDAERHLSDLQRRFEMAVEDVRELKTKNAKLEAQLSAASQRPGVPIDTDGMDWESQKRRLLASLAEEGDEDGDPVRAKERATIEGTINITDAVVALKDETIAELQAQLAAGGGQTAAVDAVRDQAVDELLEGDEVIQQHRKRIAQLEQEMEQTLRAAELELSVERAKMARQKAELEELRADLELQREAQDPSTAPGSGEPRRKWLSKLGLGGDEK